MDTKNLEQFIFENYSAILIGNLIHGVIHNLNGPLQTLTMQCDMNKIEYERFIKEASELTQEFKDKFKKKCDNLEKELNKLKDITTNIGQKKGEQSKRPVILSYIIENAINFWKADLFFKHQLKVNLKLPEKDIYIITEESKLTNIIDACLFLNLDALKKAKDQDNNDLSIDIELEVDKDNSDIKILTISNNCKKIEIEAFPESINLNSISGLIIDNLSKELGIKMDILEKSFKITI